MSAAANSIIISPGRGAARFLLQYYDIWGRYFPGLNKRAHWHVLFLARTDDNQASRTGQSTELYTVPTAPTSGSVSSGSRIASAMV
jgi:hypothetical protein